MPNPSPAVSPITIAGRPIGPAHPPFVIAELSANHNGSLEAAFRIIDAAVAAGPMRSRSRPIRRHDHAELVAAEFQITQGKWAGQSLYQLYQSACTPWDWHPALFDHARKRGITLFSSPFDPTAIDLLEDLERPGLQERQLRSCGPALIRYAASTGKPMIISTGMADATRSPRR